MLGLSILIPVYNRDVTSLVRSLAEQAAEWGGPVEIICLDDGSEERYRLLNRPLADLPQVTYQELLHNIGRAAVRNCLAASAHQPWFLLLDNNVSLLDTRFLTRYAAAAVQASAPVLIGGTTYATSSPADAATYLRWYYGRRREAFSAAVRQRKPHAQFKLKNVLLRAEVFSEVKLDESLTRYGHEDTKFGWHLEAAGIAVLHLDNPVLHDGLEAGEAFLLNSRQAVQNLVHLYRREGLGADTKLLRAALRLRGLGLGTATSAALSPAEPLLRRQLLGRKPKLRNLDILKLLWALRALEQ
ncbi:glycosyl transferase family 2 [Hymenobacter roseosalivarius DSM 11622]|uniref:Glycosyl transferase family 2 n=1 Tax=Hymenobacter roseosalivarius DSM 11622 TaxID=645990 RepID=A0A1W1W493_9BACT|nr:glycosyltransferase family A protein [Hymenobacter roseosalivarius]SMC00462.1 glycosyl transferase family 2 [Hymenobacter roseosalivarius DSM 11622]